MNREVNLTKRVKIDGQYRFCPVVFSANGRIKADSVYVNSHEEHHTEGAYYIEWYDGAKRSRKSVGIDALQAISKQKRKLAELNARNHGIAIVEADSQKNGNRLAAAVADFLAEIERHKKPGTHLSYKNTLEYFLRSCHKTSVGCVTREDLLAFCSFLRVQHGQTARTISNKFVVVISFLKAQGVRALDLGIKKDDWPKFVEEEPEIYEQEDLDALFVACSDEERLWFEFFLMTGMRDQEVMHTAWSDLNFKGNTVRVSHKPEYSWTPKAYKEREIPIPAKLSTRLKACKLGKTVRLVFPNGGGRPRGDFLERLKRVAKRAGLDENQFWLHKFRATFATRCLMGGVDLTTLQLWLGHDDLKSTMRYLKPARSHAAQSKVNEIFA